MTSEAIVRRNINNALRSTGPRTDRGKARSSANAIKHGATGAPDAGLIAKYLSVILETPKLSLENYFPLDDRGNAALQLATAEAQLVNAEQTLQDFEAGASNLSDWPGEVAAIEAFVSELMSGKGGNSNTRKEGMRLLERLMRKTIEETHLSGKRHRLLKRYLREAQTGRTRALKNWVRVNVGAA